MTNDEIIKAAYCCADDINCDLCPLDNCNFCAKVFAKYIKAKNLESKKDSEPVNIADLPDFGNLNDTNGIIILESFKNIVKGLGGRVKSVYADNSEARLEYELGDCGYFLNFGGN